MNFYELDGHKDLARDPSTNAVLNVNTLEYQQYLARREVKSEKNDKIQNIEDDFANMKNELKEIKSIGEKFNKELVVYLSMGFGNPYGEPWSFEIVEKWIDKLSEININIISISDTIGLAKKSISKNPKKIQKS